jgi:hypothetical protein
MIRAKLRLSSDGVQYLAPIFHGRRMVAVICGPADCVLGALPDFGVLLDEVEGLTDELRKLWGVRKEALFQVDTSRQFEGGCS